VPGRGAVPGARARLRDADRGAFGWDVTAIDYDAGSDRLYLVNEDSSADPAADIAEPFGVLDLADVQAFIAAFAGGCP